MNMSKNLFPLITNTKFYESIIGAIGEDNDQNSNEPYQENKLHHDER